MFFVRNYYNTKTSLQYSQPEKKIILYDLDSIDEYLEENAKERF
jgi:hypothetical protein